MDFGVLVVWAAAHRTLDELLVIVRGDTERVEAGYDYIRCSGARRPALTVRVHAAGRVQAEVRHAATGRSVELTVEPGGEAAVGWYRGAFRMGWPCGEGEP